jgi:3-oxoacyl-[acyl-carrier-protein] synthase-1
MVYVRRADRLGSEARVNVAGLGFGKEKVSVLSEEPLLGQGLAIAGKQALAEAGWGFHELDFRISDVTGENYGFREHALAEARLARIVRSESQPLWHPADAIGDTGAAVGVIHLLTAATAMSLGYAPGRRAGCFTSSVVGDRAVAALQYSEV